MPDIIPVESAEQIDQIRSLFIEYENWLGFDLCFQGFERELQDLPGRYSTPDGRLYLAVVDDLPAGCIGLRKIGEGICEMKRLFVRDAYRGLGLGRMLIDAIISDARQCGYRQMRLDTYPLKMGNAVRLYESYGFEPIESYYDNPHADIVFMGLVL